LGDLNLTEQNTQSKQPLIVGLGSAFGVYGKDFQLVLGTVV
jgi:hypothetical protein